jgi:FkbM family methyltransferase
MSVKIKRILRKLKSFGSVMTGTGHVTFSQFGEDIIIIRMLERFGVQNITYLDIGANDPINGSNTYGLYLRGHRGVLIEPNKSLYDKIRKVRPEDKCLNLGISDGNQTEADYYMFSEANCGMNTFSKEEALSYEKDGMKIQQVVKMPLKDINELLAEHFKTAPTVLSMDVEGLDEMILNKWDFGKWQPLLICLESVVFKANGDFVKRDSMMKLMASKGYYVYADTHINTIFCHQQQYNKLVK